MNIINTEKARQLNSVSHYLHYSMHNFCMVSKVCPECRIIILFMKFSFSIMLYEFLLYPPCEVKYLLQIQKLAKPFAISLSEQGLCFLMVSFLSLFFRLPVTQIACYTHWLCLLCVIQENFSWAWQTIHPGKGSIDTIC